MSKLYLKHDKLHVSGLVGKIRKLNAPVAQWIEQLGSNESVGGSNPSGRTKQLQTIDNSIIVKQNHVS
jgi:hypothetical protein